VAGGRQLAGGGVLIRPPDPGDEPGYELLLLDPEVSAWLRPEPLSPFSSAEIAEMLADDLRHWRDAGFGPWVLVDRDDEELVGRVGLHRTSVGGELVTELAWTVRPGWQGRGLATAARPVYQSPKPLPLALARAAQTADIAAEHLKIVCREEKLLEPGFRAADLPRLLRKHPQDALMLVGHEPDFSEVIASLTGGNVKMAKAGVALIDYAEKKGKLLWLVPPKLVRR